VVDDDDDDDDDHHVAHNPHDNRRGKAPTFKPRGGRGFRVEFEMPFRAKDVLRELSRPETPLGFDKETSTVSVIRPGETRDKVFSPGFVRKTVFKNKLLGNTSSKLVHLEEEPASKANAARSTLTWEVLSADGMPFHIASSNRKKPPICTIELQQAKTWSGSTMAVSWDYEYVSCMNPCCCLGPVVPCLLQTFVSRSLLKPDNVFKDQMVDRGYPDLNEQSATRLQALAKAFAVRRAEARRKANKPVYDNDDDDDDDAKRSVDDKGRRRASGHDSRPSRPQRRPGVGPDSSVAPSRPERMPASKTKAGNGASAAPPSRPTRPGRGVQFGAESQAVAAGVGGAAAVGGAATVAASAVPKAESAVRLIDDDDEPPSKVKVIDD